MTRVAYVNWPSDQTTGGVKTTFRHVEALRCAGVDAYVATENGRGPTWFETTAPVLPLTHIAYFSDIMVFPENNSGMLKRFAAWPNRKIVFCQNQHMIYRGLDGRDDYSAFGVEAMLCTGTRTAAFCRRRCPGLKLFTLTNAVDRRMFRPCEPKQLQIAFAPRKRPAEASIIQDLFQAEHPEFRSIPWIRVAGLPETEVARILGESALYLALSRFESFSLSVLEAFASDCVVAGFSGVGISDYVTESNGYWAPEDDCAEAASQLAQAVRTVVEGADRLDVVRKAVTDTLNHYDHVRFTEGLLESWRALLDDGTTRPLLPVTNTGADEPVNLLDSGGRDI